MKTNSKCIIASIPFLVFVLMLTAADLAVSQEKQNVNPLLKSFEEAGFMSYDSDLSNGIGDMKSKSYGFAASLAPEKKYFKLGVYFINIDAAISSGDKAQLAANLNLLSQGLEDIGAPTSYLNSLALIRKEIDNENVSYPAVRKMYFVLKPILSDFIVSKGEKYAGLVPFGEWAQSLNLASKSILASKNPDKAATVLKLGLSGASFSKHLASFGLPQGLTKAINQINTIAQKEAPKLKEVQQVVKACENIIDLMTS